MPNFRTAEEIFEGAEALARSTTTTSKLFDEAAGLIHHAEDNAATVVAPLAEKGNALLKSVAPKAFDYVHDSAPAWLSRQINESLPP